MRICPSDLLLDPPDSATQAQIAELEARAEILETESPSTPTPWPLESIAGSSTQPSTYRQRSPPIKDVPSVVEPPPRIAFPQQPLSSPDPSPHFYRRHSLPHTRTQSERPSKSTA